VFRLLALKEVGATDAAIREASQARKNATHRRFLSQLDDKPGDSYATGSAYLP